VLLFIITALLFLRATRAGFLVLDDTTFVNRNPHVNTGLTTDNFRHAFTGMDEVNWEPLTTLSHMLDCQFFALRPAGHHLISVLIHALNTAGLFLLLRKLTGAQWRSFIVAALFGWHPLRVESVAWIAERKDVLCMTFWLLATWAYACYVQRKKTGGAKLFYWLCFLFFALGLMAKPMMVTFPFFLMLLDYWPLKRTVHFSDNSHAVPAQKPEIDAPISPKAVGVTPSPGGEGRGEGGQDLTRNSGLRQSMATVIFDKIPFLLLSALDCVLTYLLQKQYGAVSAALPFSARAANAVIGYARYLGKFLWPTNLAVLYPIKDYWAAAQVTLAGALILGITIAAYRLRKRAPWFIVGWLWFLGTLVPVIGFVQVGEQSIADRYTYIPMIGIAVALVWGLCEMKPQWRGVWAAPLLVIFGCCALLTYRQLGYWEDSRALFEHTVQVTDGNYLANTILGDVYLGHGEPERAVELFQEALRINPGFTPAAELLKNIRCEQDVTLGKAFLRHGRYDQALASFQDAEELRYASPDVHYSLGVIYRYQHHFPDAERHFKVALVLKPDSYQARRFLAYTLADDGKKDQALRQFELATQEHPESFEAHTDAATALAAAGHRKESITQLKLALQLHPNDLPSATRLAELEAAESH